MATLSADTPPEIEQIQIRHLRELGAGRKIELVGQMIETVHALALSGLRKRYPDDTPALQRRRLADLLLGDELAARIWEPLPDGTQ